MSGFRESAWLREAHDRAECPSECPACAQIENAQDREARGGRDLLVSSDYPEDYR